MRESHDSRFNIKELDNILKQTVIKFNNSIEPENFKKLADDISDFGDCNEESTD